MNSICRSMRWTKNIQRHNLNHVTGLIHGPAMYLHALATALPPTAYTQAECWKMAQGSEGLRRLNRRSVLTLQAILRHDSGITTRHFAMPELNRVFSLTPDELNENFRREAPRLAGRALAAAL